MTARRAHPGGQHLANERGAYDIPAGPNGQQRAQDVSTPTPRPAGRIELTEDDLEQIHDWYHSAAWESATTDGSPERNARLKALLEKLNFKPESIDESEFMKECER